MSKAALVLVGLAAAVGIGLAVNHADAAPKPPKPPSQDDPDADDGEVIEHPDNPPQPEDPGNEVQEPIPDPPAGGNGPGTGTGAPNTPDFADLPDELRNIDLSGNEQYLPSGSIITDGKPFRVWQVANTLNGMDMIIYRSIDTPENWISMFIHPDPPGSTPPSHMIVYKMSESPLKLWMIQNLAGLDH